MCNYAINRLKWKSRWSHESPCEGRAVISEQPIVFFNSWVQGKHTQVPTLPRVHVISFFTWLKRVHSLSVRQQKRKTCCRAVTNVSCGLIFIQSRALNDFFSFSLGWVVDPNWKRQLVLCSSSHYLIMCKNREFETNPLVSCIHQCNQSHL